MITAVIKTEDTRADARLELEIIHNRQPADIVRTEVNA